MKVVGLFAGIGGFELGFHRAGHETILLCDSWEPARAVLRERFPGIPIHDDIRTLTDLPSDTDIVCAGFPCQDLSQAGKTEGITGARSGLIDYVFDLLERRAVPWVVLENVSFMLQLGGGQAMAHIVRRLETLGYRWAYRVVNSLGFLPQRRQRVFLVASLVADPADVILGDEATPRYEPTTLDRHAHGFYWTEGTRGLGWAPNAVPTIKNGSTVGIPGPPAILMPDGRVIKPDIRDAERLQGFPEDWTKPAESVARASWRWSLVGNAVTVDVATWLGSRLNVNPGYDVRRDRPMAALPKRWPKAARHDGATMQEVSINDFPVWRGRQQLHQFLRHNGQALSHRAVSGFLSRARASSLRFEPGFLDRLDHHRTRMAPAPATSAA